MAKEPKKPQGNSNTPQNSSNSTSKLDSELSKSRQQIYQENYQKNKERKKLQRRQRYQQQKEQSQLAIQQAWSKYYQAEAIEVLMSFKEYTELNQEKRKLWLDFNWTLQDCQRSFKEGYADIVMIMKLEAVAHKLVRDFWDTAKNEEKQKAKSWNSLDDDEQQRLIRYWGYEKTRMENNYLTTAEQLEKQSQEYLKAIELAKFHEERGKIKCSCYACEEKKVIQKEVKKKVKKELEEAEQKLDDYWGGGSEKEECPNCGKMVKELDEENGVCKKCMEEYE